MILDTREYLDQARIAVGSLTDIRSAAIFLSQRRTSGFRGSSTGNSIEPTSERDYGLRIWVQKADGECYFSLFPLGDPKQLASEIKSVHDAGRWVHASATWPFGEIEEDCYRLETSYRDPQIDIIEPSEVQGRFNNLAKRLREAIAEPIQNKVIDEYLFRYRMIENEECLWTTGSRRPITHSSSRFVIDLQVKIGGIWVCEGFEEAQFLNLDWSRVSNWAKRWISRLAVPQSAWRTGKNEGIYFSNYATKQICFATHKWVLNQLKYGREKNIIEHTKRHPMSKLVSMYDNPREPKVCGRRIWEGRGHFATGTKFWEEGQWAFSSVENLPTRSRGTSELPEPTLCNLVFAPGKSDYVDIFAKSPRGLWIPSLVNASVSPDGIFTAEAFVASYDEARRVYPRGNVKLMAPLFSILENIEDVGRHLQWYHSIGTSDWLVNGKCFNIETLA
ncbi:MAG TPA: metallopeptidase TldD-related protein [Bdellovibrionota bacterium]|nr:metallopeptidase TldD-related protein [Bdellovibrionota bacterium]